MSAVRGDPRYTPNSICRADQDPADVIEEGRREGGARPHNSPTEEAKEEHRIVRVASARSIRQETREGKRRGRDGGADGAGRG
jgi:hypothetical protein